MLQINILLKNIFFKIYIYLLNMQKKHLLTISWSVHSYQKKVYTIQIGF